MGTHAKHHSTSGLSNAPTLVSVQRVEINLKAKEKFVTFWPKSYKLLAKEHFPCNKYSYDDHVSYLHLEFLKGFCER